MHFGVSATCNKLTLGGYENKTFQAAAESLYLGAVFYLPTLSRHQLLFTSLSGEQINKDLEFVLNSSESLAGGEILPQQCDSGFAFLSIWGSVELLGFLCGTIWLFVRHSLPIREAFPGKLVILLNCLDICCDKERCEPHV